jgi:hypothetical protein
MVSFDANVLSILLLKAPMAPIDFRTKSVVTNARERLNHEVKTLSQKGEKVRIPDPALSEFLVAAVLAGASIQEYLKIIREAQHFVTRPFGIRAGVETAERLAKAIKAGDKREGESEPWEKLKFDRQIIAVSIVEGANAIYTTDKGVYNQAIRWGIKPVHPGDLVIPPLQQAFPDIK